MALMRQQSRKMALIMSLMWVLTILYGEMFAYWVPVFWTCSWPHLHHPSVISGGSNPNDFVRVAVLTDPQMMDRTSLNLPPKSLALEAVQFYTDLYMRRAFLSTVLSFKPDAIIFLGDYFDGGPGLTNEEWQASVSRFKHIFDLGRRGSINDIPIHYIPGNHDIGYAWHVSHKPEVVARYESQFGVRNHIFTIGQVDFVAIDAQIIDGKIEDDPTARTWNFINNVSMGSEARSRVLLTHIPLYRPDWTSCGPHRTSEVINQRITRSTYDQRIIYQNYVTVESSKRLLDLIQPALVLSGHDHDQCSVTHKAKYGYVKEHTVGTLSWQQGNWYPSFMLLSVGNFTSASNSSPETKILADLCFLPKQLFIYIWYIILFVITILVLLFWPSHGFNLRHHFNHLMAGMKKLVSEGLLSSGTKEKNEDENCEYEEIWDAEGGMHLVKKPRKSPINSKEINSVERGTAVKRTARRQMADEQEALTKSDSDGGSLPSATVMGRSSRTVVVRIVMQRCLRVLSMIFVIAVVNVPLYILLLFKDWIE